MKKKKIDSRVKGSSFERTIAKKLQTWTGAEFQRSPHSGAWGTTNTRQEFRGDIVCSNPNFLYSIECKKYANFTIETLISSHKNPIWGWFRQCLDQTPTGKIPLLVFAQNRSDVYCMSTSCPVGGKAPIFILNNTNFLSNNPDIYLFRFQDLLQTDSTAAFMRYV